MCYNNIVDRMIANLNELSIFTFTREQNGWLEIHGFAGNFSASATSSVLSEQNPQTLYEVQKIVVTST